MQNEPDETIITATMENDLEGMKDAIKLGADINIQNFLGKRRCTMSKA